MATHFWNLILLIGLLLGACPPAHASPAAARDPLPHLLVDAVPLPAQELPVPGCGARHAGLSTLSAVRATAYHLLAGGSLPTCAFPLALPAETPRLRLPRSRATLPPLCGLPATPRAPPA